MVVHAAQVQHLTSASSTYSLTCCCSHWLNPSCGLFCIQYSICRLSQGWGGMGSAAVAGPHLGQLHSIHVLLPVSLGQAAAGEGRK